MKKYKKIIIVLFIVLIIFIFRNKIYSFFDNTFSYFKHNNPQTEIKEVKLFSKIDMPGALEVASDIFDPNNQKVILSKEKVIELTNKYRLENGNLKALKENQKLNTSAEKKLLDMFTGQYFEHISPNNIGVADLSEEAGYHYILIAENLAMGNFEDENSLIEAWVNSKGHRENIMNQHYQEIGVAVGKGNFEGKDIWLAVQHFGTPQNVCPIIDTFLYNTIDQNQHKINEIEEDLKFRKMIIGRRKTYEGSTYEEQVIKYNSLVEQYNNLVNVTKEKIIKYNNQVESYNSCISSFQ